MSALIKTVLIANRGEIALRIIRACRELGVSTILVHSEADANSLPVRLADKAVCIGPARSNMSYRNQQAVLGAALSFGADAIHPGYGFLAENAEFAAACEKEGIIFIGPSSTVIHQMGDKIEAKKIAKKAGVPTVPGSDGAITEFAEALKVAKDVGFPLLIKAAAGGGGRGMRVVRQMESLESDLSEIMSEAETAFGDSSVYIELYLTNIRHIEIQVMCDGETFLHMGERDCTTQRRNQKLIEEGPSPVLDDRLRQELAAAAVNLCREVKYTNAGTIEFVFDLDERKFYFIEMNTRIQVEHPVSEMITGLDLIKMQLEVASGIPLAIRQDDIRISGHAIECRINAEDPEQNFMPCPGTVKRFHMPGGLGIRMDTHIEAGYVIPPFYDSMVGKLICWGQTREEARARMIAALDELDLGAITTTAPFHKEILQNEQFVSGVFNTSFVATLLGK
ncbi:MULTISPECIES: acetyl-CoA carboxylase biotin carboxylase subunit [unclassified Shinella]|uniref:acetyl-CoA carboxylase biotin carboxylase subunit n=1 Tax=unclassified Shinella TaxID=2643062 RepID=UPI00225C883D|nr:MULTISPECIES: acetyl-CoA carboxylase biotin carboxylase subunit [unclassified Shinella]MCO5136363.1 acetyl-CoA carboxylase biotin carboxylase subunit [Shinella sp.]MDC7253962.1 acetyl-CoA carboxylase biotin carboxylase subunit [Shinella sp. YE25]CAI0336619.1 biotin carboxylase [Rhizobiaceae bacterium]CAK7255151.1 biotin carboxylase [Shinella sp. WSC3-e]